MLIVFFHNRIDRRRRLTRKWYSPQNRDVSIKGNLQYDTGSAFLIGATKKIESLLIRVLSVIERIAFSGFEIAVALMFGKAIV